MFFSGKPEPHLTMELRAIRDLFKFYRHQAESRRIKNPDTAAYSNLVSSLRSRLESK